MCVTSLMNVQVREAVVGPATLRGSASAATGSIRVLPIDSRCLHERVGTR